MKNSYLLAYLTALSGVAHAESAATSGGWQIDDARLIPSSVIEASIAKIGNQDGKAVADAVVQLYREHGYLTIEARVKPAEKRIQVVEATAAPSGPYADFLPSGEVLTVADADLAAARMTLAARLNGERVAVQVEPEQEGRAEVRTSAAPLEDRKQWGATAAFTTLGQRYAGADVGTLYGFRNLGSGQQIDASLSHGFPEWRDDSKGGRYENIALGWRRAGPEGATAVQFSHVDYKTGGPVAVLDITGTVTRLAVEHSYLVTKELSAVGRLAAVENKQSFGILGWEDRQTFQAAFAGVRYASAQIAGDLGIEQGIGGHQSYNVVPLLGTFDKHYSALIGNVAGNVGLWASGWVLTGKAGGQTGAKGTPSSSQFYLGGPDRGQAYTTGYVATPSGWYASAVLNAPLVAGVQGYGGLDHAEGSPTVGADRQAKSAFLGARFQAGKGLAGDVSFAHVLGALDDPTAKRSKVNLVLNFSM